MSNETITDDNSRAPAPTPPAPTTPAPAPPAATTPTTTQRTKLVACLWTLFGIASAYGGAALAIPLTTPTVEASTDDFAGLLYLVTVPLGFIAGTIVACLIASQIERESRSADDLFTRTELTFGGVLLPILLAVGAMSLAGALT